MRPVSFLMSPAKPLRTPTSPPSRHPISPTPPAPFPKLLTSLLPYLITSLFCSASKSYPFTFNTLHAPNFRTPQRLSRNSFRIRTSKKTDIALRNPNRINTIFHSCAHFRQIRTCNPSIYNTYKTHPSHPH